MEHQGEAAQRQPRTAWRSGRHRRDPARWWVARERIRPTAGRIVHTYRVQNDSDVLPVRQCNRLTEAPWGSGTPFELRAGDARYFILSIAALSILGYEHTLDEPAMRLWKDNRHAV